jgi:membrane-associated PAP2 superfamily phosphatase
VIGNLLGRLAGAQFGHVPEFIVDSLVHDVVAVNALELVIMAIDDQGVNHEIFKAVIVPLNDESFHPS